MLGRDAAWTPATGYSVSLPHRNWGYLFATLVAIGPLVQLCTTRASRGLQSKLRPGTNFQASQRRDDAVPCNHGAYLDVAQVTLYVFWIFFACLVYLSSARETSARAIRWIRPVSGEGLSTAFRGCPNRRTICCAMGSHRHVAEPQERPFRDVAVAPVSQPGQALPNGPTGNPMLDGVESGLLRRSRRRSRTGRSENDSLHRTDAADRGYLSVRGALILIRRDGCW